MPSAPATTSETRGRCARRLLSLAGVILLAGAPVWADEPPPAAPPAEADESGPARPATKDDHARLDGHPVGAEDLLEISVFEIPDLNRIVRVTARGTISLPLLGELRVAGLTPIQLEERLRGELAKRYLKDPQVSVFVRQHGSRKVSVLGAVGKPGTYEMLGPRTLLQVLSEAGGLTKEVGGELYVIRGPAGGSLNGAGESPATRIAINVDRLMTNRDPALDIPIQPADIVSAPIDQFVYIYVDGAVKTPGRIEQLSKRSITLMQAIAKAGGATDRANLKKIQLIRKNETGGEAVVVFNLARIRRGKDPDPVLFDGDVVVVPETFF